MLYCRIEHMCCLAVTRHQSIQPGSHLSSNLARVNTHGSLVTAHSSRPSTNKPATLRTRPEILIHVLRICSYAQLASRSALHMECWHRQRLIANETGYLISCCNQTFTRAGKYRAIRV